MLARLFALLVLLVVCTATSCTRTTGIAVRPSVSLDSGSLADTAFALVARLSKQHELTPYTVAGLSEEGLNTCYSRSYDDKQLLLCGKTKDGEVQFMLREYMTSQFTPHADSLRNALLDSLRAHFGEQSARECKWRFERNPKQSGC